MNGVRQCKKFSFFASRLHCSAISKTSYFDSGYSASDNIFLGGSSIIHYNVLTDKRHILTQDTNNQVVLWDILNVSVVEMYKSLSLLFC